MDLVKVNIRIDNLEITDNLHICQWANDNGMKWTIAHWVKHKEGYNLQFTGDRPLDIRIRWNLFKQLIIIGQAIADYKFSIE